MTLKVEFQFDFGSPNAYLAEIAHSRIEQLDRCEIRARSSPAWRHLQGDRQHVAVRFASRNQEQAGIPGARGPAIHSPSQHPNISARTPFFQVNTLMLMRGAVAASSKACSSPISAPPIITCGKSPRKWTIQKSYKSAFASSGIDIDGKGCARAAG